MSYLLYNKHCTSRHVLTKSVPDTYLCHWKCQKTDAMCQILNKFYSLQFGEFKKIVWLSPGLSPFKRITYEPPHDKTNKMACVPSEDSDQPGHPPSLISLRCEDAQADLSLRCALNADSEDSDQTGRMSRLIWVFDGRTCHFVGFVMRQLILVYDKMRSAERACETGINVRKFTLRKCLKRKKQLSPISCWQ